VPLYPHDLYYKKSRTNSVKATTNKNGSKTAKMSILEIDDEAMSDFSLNQV